jgi:hypothetical protein
MSDLPPKLIPADPSVHLASDNVSKGEGEKTAFPYPYRAAVGALLYVALMTRPDIAYAVGQVWLGGSQCGLIGYTDANSAGDRNQCRSTSGSIHFLLHGGPVAWLSKKHPDIAQSTSELE